MGLVLYSLSLFPWLSARFLPLLSSSEDKTIIQVGGRKHNQRSTKGKIILLEEGREGEGNIGPFVTGEFAQVEEIISPREERKEGGNIRRPPDTLSERDDIILFPSSEKKMGTVCMQHA